MKPAACGAKRAAGAQRAFGLIPDITVPGIGSR